MKEFVLERIRKLKPYTASDVSEGEIKLDAQENPYELPDHIKLEIQNRIQDLSLNRYPSFEKSRMYKKLADYAGCHPDKILLGNGSDELIELILLACGGPGRLVATAEPTFSMYRILSDLTGTSYKGFPLNEDFSLPVESLISSGADIIFITYPHNPTGNSFEISDIERVIEESGSLVVLDEAYYEFSKKSFVGMVKEYDNLLVLRTFSKAFSLAGIRAGYMVLPVNLSKDMKKAQLPYNFSVLNEIIIETVLDYREDALESVEKLLSSREKMYAQLKQIEGISPFESDANFILMKIEKFEGVMASLKKHKIKAREFSDPNLKSFLRVTVGTEDENKNFLKALREAE
ncbi:MAG: histidinol-phosphate transaminase [Elusimicrobia bacterium]|nr:histidinol-phosphate transaminase [Elusimicrobiota bacterium]